MSHRPNPPDPQPSASPHVGKAETDGADYRGWFVGNFVQADGASVTDDVEVKWGLHPAGDTRPAWSPDDAATTLCLLVSGRFNL